MKTASQLSKEIRAKKKAMQADPAVVDLSGIPMDAQDEQLLHDNSMTKDMGLDSNEPKPHAETEDLKADATPSHQSLMKDSAQRQDAVMPNEAKLKRMARIAKSIGR